MEKNKANQIVINEDDFLDLLYRGSKITSIVVDNPDWIQRLNDEADSQDMPVHIEWETATTKELSEFIEECRNSWYMPDEYKNLDIKEYVFGLCETDEQRDRVTLEFKLFEERSMIIILQFLKYFFDTLEKHNIMWGVGRGSSVASYVLYLMDVHQVDSLKYDLDIKEFLK